MSRHFSVAIFITILLLLGGCQSKANESDINKEAEEIYLGINKSWSTGEYVSESDQEQITKFKEEYIVNYKDYPSDDELIMEMEKLINGYQLYYVSIGQDNEEAKERYSDDVNESLANLDKQFNK